MSVASQEFWDEFNERVSLEFNAEALNFRDLFDAYLRPGGSCFEVGCYPGRFLIYLCKRFGYTANGIDATPFVHTRMQQSLRQHGVPIGDLICEDFESFRCEKTFDVVCSFGFIEHFKNLEQIIQKHVSLLKPGGTLVLACPNFRGLQYVFHRIFDADNLRRHALSTMSLSRWRKALAAGGMEIVHDGYYRTVDFWFQRTAGTEFRDSVGGAIVRVAKRFDNRVRLPTPWLSPFIVSISRKVDSCASGARTR